MNTDLERRRFLQGAAATGIIVASPGIITSTGKFLSAVGNGYPAASKWPWTVDASGMIRYVGDGEVYSVTELHRWLHDRADELFPTDDVHLDITCDVPSYLYSDGHMVLNPGYDIDDHTARFLKDGTIKQHDMMYASFSGIPKRG